MHCNEEHEILSSASPPPRDDKEDVSLLELCFRWPPTSLSRRSLRFKARKRLPRIVRIPHSGQRRRSWPEWGMLEIVIGFDPSLEPLRPMGPAHRGVLKRDGLQGRWGLSQNKNYATQTCSNPKTLIAGGLAP